MILLQSFSENFCGMLVMDIKEKDVGMDTEELEQKDMILKVEEEASLLRRQFNLGKRNPMNCGKKVCYIGLFSVEGFYRQEKREFRLATNQEIGIG
jgi:hypothetical protein